MELYEGVVMEYEAMQVSGKTATYPTNQSALVISSFIDCNASFLAPLTTQGNSSHHKINK